MPILGPVPVENDLIRSLGLISFDGGGDWHLTADGDIGLTRDGDLAVGDASFNAMCRLIGAWRYNVPAMRLMFDAVLQTREARPGLDADLERSL